MHYSILVTVDIPKTTPNPEQDRAILTQLELIGQNRTKDDIVSEILAGRLRNLSNEFARHVDDEVSMSLEPYCEQTDNPAYLEFEDHTDELRDEYENGSVDCIKLPEGKIVSVENPRFWNRYIIGDDGKIYQKYFGPLQHPKRSKSAKKMSVLKNYPYKKLYKTFDDFAQNERYFTYDEQNKGYGYTYNPNAFYDWYSIGGRWPFLFLVKEECEEFSLGESSWAVNDIPQAPKGYKWVCAARKKDIQWKAMYRHNKELAVQRFRILKKAFQEKKLPEEFFGAITDQGIRGFDEMEYIDGETIQQYLARMRVLGSYQYPSLFYGYFDGNEYVDKAPFYIEDKDKRNRIWHKMLNRFIKSLSDDMVLVGVDCHI